MNALPADPAALRTRRKEDLLLASSLARTQFIGTLDEITQTADRVVHRVRQVQAWLSDPRLWMVFSAVGSLVGGLAFRRRRSWRSWRMLRWGLLAWRVWRAAAGTRARAQALR